MKFIWRLTPSTFCFHVGHLAVHLVVFLPDQSVASRQLKVSWSSFVEGSSGEQPLHIAICWKSTQLSTHRWGVHGRLDHYGRPDNGIFSIILPYSRRDPSFLTLYILLSSDQLAVFLLRIHLDTSSPRTPHLARLLVIPTSDISMHLPPFSLFHLLLPLMKLSQKFSRAFISQ